MVRSHCVLAHWFMAPPAAVPRCATPHAPTRRFVVPGIASGGRDRQISPPVDGTRDAFGPWPARLTWLLLPLVSGPALGDALNGTSRPVQVVASVGLWVGWAAVLVATLVPTTVSLTALRVVAPAAVVVAGAALVAGGTSTADTVGLPRGLAAGLAAFWPGTGEVFVDGSSYGDERRMPLRVPGPPLAGPLAVGWGVAVVGVAAGAVLLAARPG